MRGLAISRPHTIFSLSLRKEITMKKIQRRFHPGRALGGYRYYRNPCRLVAPGGSGGSAKPCERTQCQNNLKQIGLAVLNHESTQKYFPSSGWGWHGMATRTRDTAENSLAAGSIASSVLWRSRRSVTPAKASRMQRKEIQYCWLPSGRPYQCSTVQHDGRRLLIPWCGMVIWRLIYWLARRHVVWLAHRLCHQQRQCEC